MNYSKMISSLIASLPNYNMAVEENRQVFLDKISSLVEILKVEYYDSFLKYLSLTIQALEDNKDKTTSLDQGVRTLFSEYLTGLLQY